MRWYISLLASGLVVALAPMAHASPRSLPHRKATPVVVAWNAPHRAHPRSVRRIVRPAPPRVVHRALPRVVHRAPPRIVWRESHPRTTWHRSAPRTTWHRNPPRTTRHSTQPTRRFQR
jgi:hypothetical protein